MIIRRRTLLLAALVACSEPSSSKQVAATGMPDTSEPTEEPSPDPPEDTGDTGDTGAPVVVEIDPWPELADLPDGSVSLVYDGAVLTSGQTVAVDTPPAGLPDLTTLRFAMTNRTDAVLALPADPAAWLSGEAFAWVAPPPTTLEPEQSVSLELMIGVQEETAATVHSAELTIPGGPEVSLEARVPRPLRVVVVGSGGYTAVSDSYGAAYETEINPGNDTAARDVVWGDGRFLRADQETTAWTAPGLYQWSDDGLTWYDSTSTEDGWVSDCVHAWSQFYCVRSSSWTSSEDGSLVLHDFTGWGDLLIAVAFVPGDEVGRAADSTDPDALFAGDRLVAVGRNGRRMLSSDGASWTADTSSSLDAYFNAVAYGQGLLVAVGGYDSMVTAVSDDGGETWTETVVQEDERYASFSSMVYGDGVFLAGARTNVMDNIWRSTDGITWEGLGNERVEMLDYINGWFIGHVEPWGEAAYLVRSEDGVAWETTHVLPEGVTLTAAATEAWQAP